MYTCLYAYLNIFLYPKKNVLKCTHEVANILPGKVEGGVIREKVKGRRKRKEKNKIEPKKCDSICVKLYVCVLKKKEIYVYRHVGLALEY